MNFFRFVRHPRLTGVKKSASYSLCALPFSPPHGLDLFFDRFSAFLIKKVAVI
jgi:hypothetical protein